MINYKTISKEREVQSSETGMTSVVTAVLIIAIVLGLIIGPYLTIVVPEQSKVNEAEHLDDVKESFMDLRAAINTELDEGTPNMVLTARIPLGTEDENLFVLGGTGNLLIDPSGTYISVYGYYDPLSIYARGGGNIKYTSKNLYHSDKSYVYETGGILVAQKSTSVMDIDPDFKLTRRQVFKYIGLNSDFGELADSDRRLENIYLIKTTPTTITFDKARISWSGGNATLLTKLDIGSGLVEWSGTADSGTIINFTNNYNLAQAVDTMRLYFDSDLRDADVTLDLMTSDARTITDTWPVTALDTIAHPYNITVPSENAKKFKFKNICEDNTTIKNISVSWTGNAKLWKINIANHGGDVWSTGGAGEDSPAFIDLTKDSIFQTDEKDDVKLYFTGDIDDKNLNIKFFTENSSNKATAEFPLNLNETYINASFTITSLVTPNGDKISTGGKRSKIIKTTLISSENNRYIWPTGEMIVFDITTTNANAWLQYLNDTLGEDNELVWDHDDIGAFPGDYYITSTQNPDNLVNIKMIINSIYKFDCNIGIIKVEFG